MRDASQINSVGPDQMAMVYNLHRPSVFKYPYTYNTKNFVGNILKLTEV